MESFQFFIVRALLFAPTVSVSSTDLWQTSGLRSRKHGNLQTPGQGQQQNRVNQVNLNTRRPTEAVCSFSILPFLPSFALSSTLSFFTYFFPEFSERWCPPAAAETCPLKKRAVDSGGRCLMCLRWVGVCRHAQLSRSVRLCGLSMASEEPHWPVRGSWLETGAWQKSEGVELTHEEQEVELQGEREKSRSSRD